MPSWVWPCMLIDSSGERLRSEERTGRSTRRTPPRSTPHSVPPPQHKLPFQQDPSYSMYPMIVDADQLAPLPDQTLMDCNGMASLNLLNQPLSNQDMAMPWGACENTPPLDMGMPGVGSSIDNLAHMAVPTHPPGVMPMGHTVGMIPEVPPSTMRRPSEPSSDASKCTSLDLCSLVTRLTPNL